MVRPRQWFIETAESAKLRCMRFRFSLCCLILCLLLAPVWANRRLSKTYFIRQKCAQIDAQRQSATRQTVAVLEMSHEGSQITALEFKAGTRKLFVKHLGTMGQVKETIYLENGRPIRIMRIESTYDAPLSGRVVGREEEYLYFQNGSLIQRDFIPTMVAGRAVYKREDVIHQTSIESPAQAREWKNKETEWRQRIAQYERALKEKQ